jgi:tetratricopeptide (TPR) repeat protein
MIRCRIGLRIVRALLLACVLAVPAVAAAQDDERVASRRPALDELKLGLGAMEAAEYEQAFVHFERASELATNSEIRFQADFGLATAASALGRLVEAEAAFERAVAARPDHVEALYSYGLLLKQTNRPDRAASFFARAAVNDPTFVEAFVELGVVYARLGRHADSAAACQRGLGVDPASEGALLCLGVARYHLGQYPGAQQHFEAVLETDLNNARARYGLGLSKLYQEDRNGAIQEYAVLKELDPELARELYQAIFPAQ